MFILYNKNSTILKCEGTVKDLAIYVI